MTTLKDRLERLKDLGLVRGSSLSPADSPGSRNSSQKSTSGNSARNSTRDVRQDDLDVHNPESCLPVRVSGDRKREPENECPNPLYDNSREMHCRGGVHGGHDEAFLGNDWIQSKDYVWTREIRISCPFPEYLDLENFRVPFLKRQVRTAVSDRKDTGSKGDEESSGIPGSGNRNQETIVEIQDSRIASEEHASTYTSWSGLRFMDFETTGLSGGSGTVAFLSATGRSEGDEFIVRQRFLADFPGEADFIRCVLEDVCGCSAVLTYNGASFDLPLLRTRCIMNAIPFPEIRHVDVLTSARRLWKATLGSVSLQQMETGLLGHFREDDVPGSEIPPRWFGWLDSGNPAPLAAIFRHNVQDILSLAKITARAARIFENPLRLVRNDPGYGGVDALRLAQVCFARNRCNEGEELLLSLASDGVEKAGLILSGHYRRLGKIEERGAILELLPGTSKVLSERSRFEEHSMKNPQQAYVLAKEALMLGPEPALEKWLVNRCRRLEKSINRIKTAESSSL